MRKYFIGILFIFLLPALACSLGGSDEGGEGAAQANLAAQEAATPAPAEETVVEEVEAVTETQKEAETQETTSEEAFTGVTGLGQLSSYRVNFIMKFDGQSGGQPSKGSIEMTLEETQNPPARHLLMTMEGDTVNDVGGTNAMDIYMVGDMVYMKNAAMGDSWISFSGGEAESFEQGFFAPDEQLEMPDTANCSGTETVNGVEAKHCHFTEKDINDNDVVIESLQGDVWVAVDGGYIVKYTMTATGYGSASTDEEGLFDFGDVSFEYNLSDANGDFTITLPPEAENADGIDLGGLGGEDADPGDIPVLDNAEELMSMGGLVTYYTAAGVPEVVDYYRQQLPPLGWAENDDQSYSDESTALLNFEKDGQSMMVTVTIEDGRTNVIVTTIDQ